MIKINNNEIIFLIRSYNEWTVVLDVLKEIAWEYFENILFIDDWSTDWTEDILNDWNIDLLVDNFIYLKHFKNRWAWAALETWFEYLRRYWSKYKYVITFDADWQHKIKDVYDFIYEFEKDKDLDIVFWSRFIGNKISNIPFFRKIILFWWKIFTFFISNIRLSDAHNWYRMIKINSLNNIKLTMSWMEYASELIDQVSKKWLKFKEVPVSIEYTEYSLSKWQKSSNAIIIVLKIIWNKFFK